MVNFGRRVAYGCSEKAAFDVVTAYIRIKRVLSRISSNTCACTAEEITTTLSGALTSNTNACCSMEAPIETWTDEDIRSILSKQSMGSRCTRTSGGTLVVVAKERIVSGSQGCFGLTVAKRRCVISVLRGRRSVDPQMQYRRIVLLGCYRIAEHLGNARVLFRRAVCRDGLRAVHNRRRQAPIRRVVEARRAFGG